jgi:hypothetical protein
MFSLVLGLAHRELLIENLLVLIFVTGSRTIRSVRNWFLHWNAEVYAGTIESFKLRGPMALLIVMFLEDSLVEQRVCLIFKHTSRTDSLFRRFTLTEDRRKLRNSTDISCLRASCISYIRSVSFTEFSFLFKELRAHPQ